MQHITIRGLIAFGASITLLLAFAACSGDDNASPTPSRTATAVATPTTTPTATATGVTPTPSPVPADAPEVQELLALPGFADFARAFQTAVDDNDTQFFIDHAHYEDFSTCSGAAMGTPVYGGCNAMGALPNGAGIPVGVWESEGDVVTPAGYASVIAETLGSDMAPDAKMFAVGRSIRQAGTPTTGADFAIANVGGQGGASKQYALSVQVDEIDGSWKIVSLAHATVPLVPEVYVWYAPWAEVFLSV